MNDKRVNLLDLKNISTKMLITSNEIMLLFDRYNIRNYGDLETAVNNNLIKDEYLIERLNEVKEKKNISINEVLIDSLRINKEVTDILDKYNIKTFADLGIAIGNSIPKVVSNLYLLNAFNIVAKELSKNSNIKRSK